MKQNIVYKVFITLGIICLGAGGIWGYLDHSKKAAQSAIASEAENKTTTGSQLQGAEVVDEETSSQEQGIPEQTAELPSQKEDTPGQTAETPGQKEDTPGRIAETPGQKEDTSEQIAEMIPSLLQSPEATEPAIESVLSGKIISIDAGHQAKGNSSQEPVGPNTNQTKAKVSSGTRGVATGKYEYELNLEVALKLKEALLAKGVEVYMVRETNDVDISNKERAELANSVQADLSLRIHADGSENSSVKGFSILVPGGDQINEAVITKSNEMAQYIEASLSASLTGPSKGIVSRSDLTGFNWSQVPAVLVEMGFMSNPEEDQLMSTAQFQDDLVKALVEGLENYYTQS